MVSLTPNLILQRPSMAAKLQHGKKHQQHVAAAPLPPFPYSSISYYRLEKSAVKRPSRLARDPTSIPTSSRYSRSAPTDLTPEGIRDRALRNPC